MSTLITDVKVIVTAPEGINLLVVKVENDFILGSSSTEVYFATPARPKTTVLPSSARQLFVCRWCQ